MAKYPYLNDSAFLQEVTLKKIKEQYVKVTVLDFQERPIKTIQGKLVGGNINIDGNSSVRRTCNLNLIADNRTNDLTNVNALISINKKVNVEIGYLNTMGKYTQYDILWFPLGVYVIISPSISHNTSGVSISLQLQDKMALLNGTCGGTFPAAVTLSEYDTIDKNGNYIIAKPTIEQIIREVVNHYGGEQLGKIIISDIDARIKQVMQWTGSSPLYVKEVEEGLYEMTTSPTQVEGDTGYKAYSNGMDVGYIYTDFTFPGELIANAGSTVCEILDKIKTTLGNFEYFYDLDGNFIFQEVKNYLNTTQSKVILNQINNDSYLVEQRKGKAEYVFNDSNIINSYTNNPQYNMIKNDFIVWGIRNTPDGSTYPIRYHLAIDSKPNTGNTYQCYFYQDPLDNIVKAKVPLEFESYADLPAVGAYDVLYAINNELFKWNGVNYDVVPNVTLQTITTKDWRTELYLSGSMSERFATDSNFYYTELANEWPKLYDVQAGTFTEEALKKPQDIDFFLDFIDSSAAISELSISNIGRRTKVINDNKVNCIFPPEIPDVVIIEHSEEETSALRDECIAKGQSYTQVDGAIYKRLAGGGVANSAYDVVRDLLYQYTSYNESISIQCLPMYYIEPNCRITVRDSQSGIYGDYIIKSISMSLDLTSNMTMSCIRALDRL